MRHALLFSVFVIASCGLAYELIAGALSSYLLGDSVTQFSTVIGTYLFAMGVGSWLSKYITRDLIGRFIQIELMVGLLGGFSAVGAVPRVHLAGGAVQAGALPAGVRRRRARRPGNSAGHAHPQARTGVQGSGVAGADLRLSRRAGGVDPVPADPRAASRHGAHRAAVRRAQRGGGAVGAAPVPRAIAGAARAGGAELDGVRPAGRRFRRGRAADDAGRNASLRRRDRLQPKRRPTSASSSPAGATTCGCS